MLAEIKNRFILDRTKEEVVEEQKQLMYKSAIDLIGKYGVEANEFGRMGRAMIGLQGMTMFEGMPTNISLVVYVGSGDLIVKVGDINEASMQLVLCKESHRLSLSKYYVHRLIEEQDSINAETFQLFQQAIDDYLIH